VPGEDLGKQAISDRFDPQVVLYRRGGSLFDSRKPTQLLFEEERSSILIPVEAKGTYRFDADGHYYIEVSGIYGAGCSDCTYQLRIVSPRRDSELKAHVKPPEPEWTERSFNRALEGAWIAGLDARSVLPADQPAGVPKPVASALVGRTGLVSRTGSSPGDSKETAPVLRSAIHPQLTLDREPNDRAAQAQAVSIPGVIEGVIERPGDLDSFKFAVKPGEKLAFELETPDAQPPQFDPRLAVVDSQGREVVSNVHKMRTVSLDTNGDKPHVYVKGREPKAVYTFQNGGDYVLQVRDTTLRYGGPNFRYRILIRPQIPHVGGISVGKPDHINLIRGKGKTLTITTSYEEGFAGQVLFTFAGLPEGVQAFPGAELKEDKVSSDVDVSPDIISPKLQKTTIVLLARSEAPVSALPKLVHLDCRPIVNGKLGESLEVRDIPLMVIEGSKQKQEEKKQSGN